MLVLGEWCCFVLVLEMDLQKVFPGCRMRSLLCPHIPGRFQVKWISIPCGFHSFHMEFVWLRAQPFRRKFPSSFHMEIQWNIALESRWNPPQFIPWIPYYFTWIPQYSTWIPHYATWIPYYATWIPHYFIWIPQYSIWIPHISTLIAKQYLNISPGVIKQILHFVQSTGLGHMTRLNQ